MARRHAFSVGHPGDDAGSSTGRWHAVEIRGGTNSCAAVRALSGKRYLPGEAPALPLPDCDCGARCECRYRHHEDRRRGPRRTADGALVTPPPESLVDRRHAEGRREQDHESLSGEQDATPSALDDTYYDYVRKSKLYE
jgi:hypothetical protein